MRTYAILRYYSRVIFSQFQKASLGTNIQFSGILKNTFSDAPRQVGAADQQSLGVNFFLLRNLYFKIQLCDLAPFWKISLRWPRTRLSPRWTDSSSQNFFQFKISILGSRYAIWRHSAKKLFGAKIGILRSNMQFGKSTAGGPRVWLHGQIFQGFCQIWYRMRYRQTSARYN